MVHENPAWQASWEVVERESGSLEEEATRVGRSVRPVGSTGARTHCAAAPTAMEGQRFCQSHSDSGIELDIFFDGLEFCHTTSAS